MSRDGRLLAIFLLLLCLAPHPAQAEDVLTWEDCVKEAKENHPDLAAARLELNQAQAAKTITESGRLAQREILKF